MMILKIRHDRHSFTIHASYFMFLLYILRIGNSAADEPSGWHDEIYCYQKRSSLFVDKLVNSVYPLASQLNSSILSRANTVT